MSSMAVIVLIVVIVSVLISNAGDGMLRSGNNFSLHITPRLLFYNFFSNAWGGLTGHFQNLYIIDSHCYDTAGI